MKRLYVLLAIAALICFASGNAVAQDTYWKNWDHMKFSLGFGKCDADTIKQSNEEGWWGTETTCEEHAAMSVGATWMCPKVHNILVLNQETGEWECVYDGADGPEPSAPSAPSPAPSPEPEPCDDGPNDSPTRGE